jgi:hypothetical protein
MASRHAPGTGSDRSRITSRSLMTSSPHAPQAARTRGRLTIFYTDVETGHYMAQPHAYQAMPDGELVIVQNVRPARRMNRQGLAA